MSNRCTANVSKYGFDEQTLISLKKSDPTGNQCIYLNWIYKQFKNGLFLLEDVMRVREDLELYHKNKGKMEGPNKDINTLTYSTLKILLYDMFSTATILQDETPGTDALILYDKPLGKLYIPLTREASCRLGSGTKWCTASTKSDNMFDEYNRDGRLYIWIDSNWNSVLYKNLQSGKSKKFQFHFETVSYMDELDNEINPELLTYFRTVHPVISQLFTRYEDSIAYDKVKLAKYIRSIHDGDDLLKKYILGNQDMEYAYVNSFELAHLGELSDIAMDIVRRYPDYMEQYNDPDNIARYVAFNAPNDQRTSLIDKYIIGHIDREVKYALLRGATWYTSHNRMDLDIKILLDPEYTVKYLAGLYRNAKKFTEEQMGNPENIVVRAIVLEDKSIDITDLYNVNPEAAVYYAIYVIRSRCKSIEIYGLPVDNDLSRKYNMLFIHNQDPPTNMLQLTPKFVDVLYGNEDKFFNMKNDIINLRNAGNYKEDDIYYTYKAYIDKYGRSEVIERYLVEYYSIEMDNVYLLSTIVFDGRLSYALGYIKPDIEKYVNNGVYYDIINGKMDRLETVEEVLHYIRMNGVSESILVKLTSVLQNDIRFFNFPELLRLISKHDLTVIYNNIRSGLKIKYALYPLIYDVRSPELEEAYKRRLRGFYTEEYYQYYWLKFLNGKMEPSLHRSSIVDVYFDNYKGKIASMENTYIPSITYLRTRVHR